MNNRSLSLTLSISIALLAALGASAYYFIRSNSLDSLVGPGETIPPEVRNLAADLKSSSKEDRAKACRNLARVRAGQTAAVVLLVRALDDSEATVRAEAAGALADLVRSEDTVRRALPALLDALEDDTPEVRYRAAYAVYRCGEWAGPFVSDLRRALRKSKDAGVRSSLIGALGAVGHAAGEALPELLEAAGDGTQPGHLRSSACDALARVFATGAGAERARAAIARCLVDDERDVRWSAAAAFWRLTDGGAVTEVAPIEQTMSSSEVPAERALAAARLGRAAAYSEEAVPALVRALGHDDPGVRLCAVHALRQCLDISGPEARLDPLISALRNMRAEVRWGAARALWLMPARDPNRVAPVLAEALGDPDAGVREEAAKALGAMGPAAWLAVPALKEAARWDTQRRWAHFQAMLAIGAPAIPALLDLLKSDQKEAHDQAVQGLFILLVTGRASRDQAEERVTLGPSLREALQDPDFAWEVLRGGYLERWGSEARFAVPALASLLRDRGRYNWQQQEVIEALAKMGPAAVEAAPALCEALSGQFDDQRVVAARALGQLGPAAASALPLLKMLLGSESTSLREAAVRSISLIDPGGEEGLAALRMGLRDESPATRIEAARRLLGVDSGNVDALTTLGEVYHAPDGGWKMEVMKALGGMSASAVEALPLAIEGMGDKEAEVRVAAVDAVERLCPGARKAAELLAPGLTDSDAWVRCTAVRAMGRIYSRNPAVLGPISTALADKEVQVRVAAAEVLREIGPPARAAIPGLTKVLASTDYGASRAPAASAMARIGPDSAEAVSVLLDVMLDANSGAQSEAAEALRHLVPEARGAVPVLTKALGHAWPWTREVAAAALGAIGPDAAPAVPVLVALLDSDDSNVREAAAFALARIGGEGTLALRRRLAGSGPCVRVDAARALVRVNADDAAAVASLVAVAKDASLVMSPDSWARILAIEALGEMAPRHADVAVPVLAASLLERAEVREKSAAALGRFGLAACGAVPALIGHLRTAQEKTREQAGNRDWADDLICSVAFVLGEIGSGAVEAIPALEEIAKDGATFEDGAKAAAEALTRIRGGK